MTLKQIKKAVDEGYRVVAGFYEVIKDDSGQYLIHCLLNNSYVGFEDVPISWKWAFISRNLCSCIAKENRFW